MNRKIIKDTFGYFGTNLIGQILAFIRGVVVAKFLGPYLFGIWNGLMLILQYSPYATLGLTNAMDREYPYYLGKGEKEEAERLKDTAFTGGMGLSACIALAIIVVAFFLRGKIARQVLIGLFVMAAVHFAEMLHCYYRELLRLDKKINLLNIAMLLFSGINCLLSILLVMRFQLYALYVAIVCGYGISIAFMLIRSNHYFRVRIERKRLVGLLKLGFPLVLIPLMSVILLTIDRLMILRFLGTADLGYYGIGALLANFILYLPIALQFVTYPYLLERYGQTHDAKALYGFLVPPTLFLSVALALVVGFLLIVIHLPITYLLPKFAPGLSAIRILTIGSFFFALVYLPINFCVALRKHTRVIEMQILCIVLSGILNYSFIKTGWGLAGVALATSLSYAAFVTMVTCYAASFLFHQRRDIVKLQVKMYAPIAYTLFIVYLLRTFIKGNVTNLAGDLRLTSLKLILLILLSAPLLYALHRLQRRQSEHG